MIGSLADRTRLRFLSFKSLVGSRGMFVLELAYPDDGEPTRHEFVADWVWDSACSEHMHPEIRAWNPSTDPLPAGWYVTNMAPYTVSDCRRGLVERDLD